MDTDYLVFRRSFYDRWECYFSVMSQEKALECIEGLDPKLPYLMYKTSCDYKGMKIYEFVRCVNGKECSVIIPYHFQYAILMKDMPYVFADQIFP